MVLDSLTNHALYNNLHPRFKKAFEYLQKTDFTKIELGKHLIDGEDLFVIVMEYQTSDPASCKMENHKKYIDIQYMVSGEEFMGVSLFTGQQPIEAYDESKDAAFFETSFASLVKVQQGQFMIFFPHDLHMPCMKTEKQSFVRKAVFKVSLV